MIRFKKKHRHVLLYVILLYSLLLLFSLYVHSDPPGPSYEEAKIVKLSEDMFVLSAYWEDRFPTSFVRVITISKVKRKFLQSASVTDLQPKKYVRRAFNISCQLVYPNQQLLQANITATIFDESLEPRFAGTFVNCAPPLGEEGRPVAVILTHNTSSQIRLPVHYIGTNQAGISGAATHSAATGRRGRPPNRTAICVRPFYENFDNLNQLGQFIAFYSRVLGVSHFSFYLMEASPRIVDFLSSLQESATQLPFSVRLVEWNLEYILHHSDALWDYGALTALTDCLYSSMSNYTYTYVVDLDELIVPRDPLEEPTTDALVRRIEDNKLPPINKTSNAYLFCNTFFCAEWNKQVDFHTGFDAFKAIFRSEDIWSYHLRAKMLVRTREAVDVGHHRIHNWVKDDVSFNTPVPYSVAILQHYRNCEGLNMGYAGFGDPVLTNKVTMDSTLLQYKEAINQSPIIQIMEQFQPPELEAP